MVENQEPQNTAAQTQQQSDGKMDCSRCAVVCTVCIQDKTCVCSIDIRGRSDAFKFSFPPSSNLTLSLFFIHWNILFFLSILTRYIHLNWKRKTTDAHHTTTLFFSHQQYVKKDVQMLARKIQKEPKIE